MRWGPPAAFARLRTLAANDIVLDIPFDVHKGRYETIPMYLAYRTGARFADGYSGAPPGYFAPIAARAGAINGGELDDVTLGMARANGYTYLLLTKAPWPLATPAAAVEARLDANPALQKLVGDADAALYRFR